MTKLLSFFSGIPGWLYALVAVAGILLTLTVVAVELHESAATAATDAAYQRGVNDTKAAFSAAQAKADAAQRQRVATQTGKQAEVSKEASHALNDTFDAIDRRAADIRMRHDKARAGNGATGPGNLPASGTAASPAQCAATGDGLPWSVALPLLTQAEKNQAQLFAILDWETEQQALADRFAAEAVLAPSSNPTE